MRSGLMDDDFRLMADRGASLAHNAGSNMRLGNGLFRMRRALDLGVNVGIGTDGANCSDNQNMREAMRYASMASKVQGPDPRKWAAVEEIYYAATAGSARALGLSHTGVLAPGYKADIVFLDLGDQLIPHNWSVNQLVHTEDATSVRHDDRRQLCGSRRPLADAGHGQTGTGSGGRARSARDTQCGMAWSVRAPGACGVPCPGLAARPYQINRYL